VKGYVRLLSVMEQNPGTSWESIIKNTTIEKTEPAEVTKEIEKPEKKDSNRESKEDLVSFKL